MSGTSLDGIDIAITDFSSSAGTCSLIAAQTFPFPEQLRENLSELIQKQHCKLSDLGQLDIKLGQFISLCIKQLLSQQQLDAHDITAIGSHGQTIFHQPDSDYPFSMQIGNGNVIAEETGITTIVDFRQRDIAAGGQGAPLVPAFHYELFASAQEDRAIINIGGISNISLLPSDNNRVVTGFDTGPGNVLLDGWILRNQHQTYDNHGQWAASGKCNDDLLALMLNEPYFQQPIPKSTGRELFNMAWLDNKLSALNKPITAVDVQSTLVELTSHGIAESITKFGDTCKTVFVCGGGAHNDSLISRLKSLVTGKHVTTTEELGLHPDWVEACAFAWLAYQTLHQQAGNLPSVTGATHPVVLGAIYVSNECS
ncbi:MAG: anhydro-N-acetylmuramic acid kinase [Gammaproteobacteria bacterium]|nr:anhydro-N-acetylmuramic acid kinase [Gammaproteobacteria bacterium]